MEPVPAKEKKPFDLSRYELEETAELVVQDPSGVEDLIGEDGVNPVKIILYGSGSKQMVKAQHKAGLAIQQRVQAMLRSGKVDKRSAELADEEQVEKLVAVTKTIINFPVTPEELYSNPALSYITRQ